MLKHVPSFKQNSILDMVLHHHEKYDGSGYPHGLIGGKIPLVARIMAVADAFDAMTSRRVYRNSYELQNALNEIKSGKNSHFDPKIADVFIHLIENETIKVQEKEKSLNVRIKNNIPYETE